MASEVSELWMVLTPDDQSLSGNFIVEELMSALQYQKPGKAAGPDSICPELIVMLVLNRGPGCVNSYLPACATSRSPRSGKEHKFLQSLSLISPQGNQKVTNPSYCCISP